MDQMVTMPDLHEHTLKKYERELKRLRATLVEMGGRVESQLDSAVQSILKRDATVATAAIESDPTVDALEHDVEQFIIRLFALRQPMADDLRHIVAALKISNALERAGDLSANIAKRSLILSQFRTSVNLVGLEGIARLVQKNLKSVVDAIEEDDATKAIGVWNDDKAIDDFYTVIFREQITYMIEDPRNITPCAHLLFVAKNLERIGDLATNIAEMVHYAVTGTALSGARPKGITLVDPDTLDAS